MEEDFVDRKKELELLLDLYDNLTKGELVVLYGRRRLGKTELVRHFLNNAKINGVYTLIQDTDKRNVVKYISEDITEQTKTFSSFYSWDLFFKYLNASSKNTKFVFVIDEFQRLHKIARDIITRFQKEWDFPLKNNQLLLLIVGSSIGMMSDIAMNMTAPLYGRVTHQIKLESFDYSNFRFMFPNLSEEKRVKIFSIFGGTPYYLSMVQKYENLDIIEIIHKLVLDKSSTLRNEPTTLLGSELRSPQKFKDILQSISQGKRSRQEIIDNASIDNPSYYFKTLIDLLDIIKLENPVLGKDKMGHYCFCDNFFDFWFRYISPNLSALELENIDAVKEKITQDINAFIGKKYEMVVRDTLRKLLGKTINGVQINFTEIGRWWNREGREIDICAPCKDKLIVGSVKWNETPLKVGDVKDLMDTSKFINDSRDRHFMIFSKNGFDEDCIRFMKYFKVSYFTLADIEFILGPIKPITTEIDAKKYDKQINLTNWVIK